MPDNNIKTVIQVLLPLLRCHTIALEVVLDWIQFKLTANQLGIYGVSMNTYLKQKKILKGESIFTHIMVILQSRFVGYHARTYRDHILLAAPLGLPKTAPKTMVLQKMEDTER